jgi:hypothetical protein
MKLFYPLFALFNQALDGAATSISVHSNNSTTQIIKYNSLASVLSKHSSALQQQKL